MTYLFSVKFSFLDFEYLVSAENGNEAIKKVKIHHIKDTDTMFSFYTVKATEIIPKKLK